MQVRLIFFLKKKMRILSGIFFNAYLSLHDTKKTIKACNAWHHSHERGSQNDLINAVVQLHHHIEGNDFLFDDFYKCEFLFNEKNSKTKNEIFLVCYTKRIEVRKKTALPNTFHHPYTCLFAYILADD